MGRSLSRNKNRKEKAPFIIMPKACLNHQNYIALSPYAIKLLYDLYANYNGHNNGDLCCAWSLMKERGWRSQTTLNEAKKELTYYGWIIPTRVGGKNMPTLYAVTFQAIDECKGKIDLPESSISSGQWKQIQNLSWKEHTKNKKAIRNVVQFTPRGGAIGINKDENSGQLLHEVEQ